MFFGFPSAEKDMLKFMLSLISEKIPVDNKTLSSAYTSKGVKLNTAKKIVSSIFSFDIEGSKKLNDLKNLINKSRTVKELDKNLSKHIRMTKNADCIEINYDMYDNLTFMFSDSKAIKKTNTYIFLSERLFLEKQLMENISEKNFVNMITGKTYIKKEEAEVLYGCFLTKEFKTKESMIYIISLAFYFIFSLIKNIKFDFCKNLIENNKNEILLSAAIEASILFSPEKTTLESLFLEIMKAEKIKGWRELSKRIPDPLLSNKKKSEISEEDINDNKYRTICSWKSGEKIPSDDKLKKFIYNSFSSRELYFSEAFYFIFKMAISVYKIQRELIDVNNFTENDVKYIFNKYTLIK